MDDRGNLSEMRAAFREAETWFSELPVPEAFRRFGDAWAPIDDLRHLTLSMAATTRALGLPAEVMLEKFGRPEAPSRTRDEVDTMNRAGLAAGGRSAPPFVPEPLPESAWTEVGRAEALAAFRAAADALEAAIGRWSEDDLDAYGFPHPFLGLLTLREWIHFSDLHARHHVAVAGRRLAGSSGA